MSTSNETPSPAAGDDRNLVTAAQAIGAPDFEERVRQFWEKNRTLLMAVVVVVLLVILGRHGLQWLDARQQVAQREAFAAATTDAARKTFAAEHAGSQLAGLAQLEVGDNAFKEGRHADARAAYEAALTSLDGTPFADRVRLGLAMTQLLQGDAAAGRQALQNLANDTGVATAVRGESAYHLAGLALAERDAATLAALSTQIAAIDPASSWAQRVMMLQTALPAPAAAAEETSAVSFGAP